MTNDGKTEAGFVNALKYFDRLDAAQRTISQSIHSRNLPSMYNGMKDLYAHIEGYISDGIADEIKKEQKSQNDKRLKGISITPGMSEDLKRKLQNKFNEELFEEMYETYLKMRREISRGGLDTPKKRGKIGRINAESFKNDI